MKRSTFFSSKETSEEQIKKLRAELSAARERNLARQEATETFRRAVRTMQLNLSESPTIPSCSS